MIIAILSANGVGYIIDIEQHKILEVFQYSLGEIPKTAVTDVYYAVGEEQFKEFRQYLELKESGRLN